MPKNIIRTTRDQLIAHLPEKLRDLEQRLDQKLVLLKHDIAHDIQLLSKQQDNQYIDLLHKIENQGFIRLSDTELIAKIFTGAKMYLDPADIALVPHLLLDGDWERNITRAWMKTVKPGDVVFDIGANFGYFGMLAAQQVIRDCDVFLFEANPSLIPYIEKTMMVNSFQQCSKVINKAVSNKRAKLTLNILKDYIGSSSLHDVDKLNEYNQNGATFELQAAVEVDAITIDAFCRDNGITAINLIKMDIEGYEDKAYQGMRGMIKQSPDVSLFVEFTAPAYEDAEQLYNQLLADFGYVYTIDDQGKIVRPKKTDYHNIIGSGAWEMPIFSKNEHLDK